MTLLVVALGGALGAVARYLAGGWVQQMAGGSFPWGTMAVNLAGSFLLGLALVLVQSAASSPEARAFIAIGFFGSFTTFSTFSYETHAMVQAGDWWRAGAYTTGSVVLGLVAIAVGAGIGSWIAPGGGSA